ncbi:MAG: DUF3159 domain-containing protein [Chloroflexi bacterium]|nr:MAG: DUF3159 domain-containing protein [Chloroflexota bacterium]
MSNRFNELVDELKLVVFSNRGLIDGIVPPLLFVLLSLWLRFEIAVWGALAFTFLLTVFRLVRRQSVKAALGGLVGVLVAIALVRLLDREEGFFLPSIISGLGTVVIALGSILFRRPMVAWTSFLARRWPLGWYWHPRVRPAYTEVTWIWVLYFLLRLLLQLNFFNEGQVVVLAGLNLVLGWPATLVLLVISYLYGTWRLRQLGGPSVDEYKQRVDPPWESQQKGF